MKDRKAEVLNLVSEPELFDDANCELTADNESERDEGELSDNDEFSGWLRALNANIEMINEPEKSEKSNEI